MTVTFELPDSLAARLGAGNPSELPRVALESVALEALRQKRITEPEFGRILGINDRYERDGFLKQHGIELDYTWEDLDQERADLRAAGL